MTAGGDPVLIEASGIADALMVRSPNRIVLAMMVRIVGLRRL